MKSTRLGRRLGRRAKHLVLGSVRRVRRLASGTLGRVRSVLPASKPRSEDAPANRQVRLDLVRLELANRFSRRPVTDGNGTSVVTVTTHGARIERAYIALESIARGRVRPARVMLWLDDEAIFRALPASLRRLERRGLEVVLDLNSYKVHTKYYPYVKSVDNHVTPMVTADDDVLYPREWLSALQSEHARFPDDVICFRAHRIPVVGDALGPYKTWTPCNDGHAGIANLGTSVSGQLFPAPVVNAIKARGDAFRVLVPDADDLWLHVCTVEEDVATRQIGRQSITFPYVPGSQAAGLYLQNVWNGGNDDAVARIYSQAAVNAIRRDALRATQI